MTTENRPLAVGLGEVLWDVFPDGKRLGGAPANFAWHAAQQGCRACVVSAVGDDALGREIESALAGKNLPAVLPRLPQPTGTVRIALDKTLTPAQNAQKYYKKYNKQKRTLAAVLPQKEEAQAELDYTLSMLAALSRAENMLDLQGAEEELRAAGALPPEKKGKKTAPVLPFRTFRFGEFSVFSGRNNVQNDRLLREAAPADLWLHTQKYHSTHVLIRTEGRKVPDDVLLAAAEVCACFSDAKEGNKVPVDYCERRFVKKPPKAKAGFVVYTDFKTVLADPKRHKDAELC